MSYSIEITMDTIVRFCTNIYIQIKLNRISRYCKNSLLLAMSCLCKENSIEMAMHAHGHYLYRLVYIDFLYLNLTQSDFKYL
jgi:hypothetical protein